MVRSCFSVPFDRLWGSKLCDKPEQQTHTLQQVTRQQRTVWYTRCRFIDSRTSGPLLEQLTFRLEPFFCFAFQLIYWIYSLSSNALQQATISRSVLTDINKEISSPIIMQRFSTQVVNAANYLRMLFVHVNKANDGRVNQTSFPAWRGTTWLSLQDTFRHVHDGLPNNSMFISTSL
jgi:hypothetical protein